MLLTAKSLCVIVLLGILLPTSEAQAPCVGSQSWESWLVYSDCASYMVVDISKCGFTEPPTVVTTSLVGTSGNLFASTGVGSILSLSTTAFTVLVYESPWQCLSTELFSRHWNITWAAYGQDYCSSNICCAGRYTYESWLPNGSPCTTYMPIYPTACSFNSEYLFTNLQSNSFSAAQATGVEAIYPPDSSHPTAAANVYVSVDIWSCPGSYPSVTASEQFQDQYAMSYLLIGSDSPYHCSGIASYRNWVAFNGTEYQPCSMQMHIDISHCNFQTSALHVTTRLKCVISGGSYEILGEDVIYNLDQNGFDVSVSYAPWHCTQPNVPNLSECDIIYTAQLVSEEQYSTYSSVNATQNTEPYVNQSSYEDNNHMAEWLIGLIILTLIVLLSVIAACYVYCSCDCCQNCSYERLK